jgi:hypothetical protein
MVSNPKKNQDWAYDFQCDLSMEAILDALEQAGPWSWTQRESYVAGSYINCRPQDGTRIKINEHPQGFVERPGEAGFSALLQTSSADAAFRQELDRTLRSLLAHIDAREIVAIEPYD